MNRGDLAQIVGLERRIFSDPWPTSAFTYPESESFEITLVAESDSGIAGYACLMIDNHEGHLTNIAVAPDFRRKSVAKRLLDRIFEIVIERRCKHLLLEVRPSNVEAINLYERYGFKELLRKPNYYRKPVEEAMVMVAHTDSSGK